MRAPLAFAAFALLAAPALADKSKEKTYSYAQEPETARFGSPYLSGEAESAEACAAVCHGDEACAAWTFYEARVAISARCDLKSFVGAAERRPGATSGVAARFQPGPIPAAYALQDDELAGGPEAPSLKRPLPVESPLIEEKKPETDTEEDDPIFTIDPAKAKQDAPQAKIEPISEDLTESAKPVQTLRAKIGGKQVEIPLKDTKQATPAAFEVPTSASEPMVLISADQ